MNVIFKQVRGYSGTDVWTDSLASTLQRQGIMSKVSYFHPYVGYFPYLAQHIDNERDNNSIVHGNTWNAFAFKDSCPMVATEHLVVHDANLDPYKTTAQKVYHKIIYRYESESLKTADCVVCVSQYTRDRLEQAFEYPDARVIYNGVDVEIFQPQFIDRESFCERQGIPKDKIILLFAGNPTLRKGADLLPKIVSQLDDSFLLLMTSGLKGKGTKNRNIRSVGRLSMQDLINLYTVCDIFVFPTRLEGMSLTVAEAMACGKPIVTTNTSSLPEMIVDGEGGFLCEKDNVTDFSNKIRYLAEDDAVREQMGAFNRVRAVEQFSIHRMATEYIDIYKSVLKNYN
jgi:glycosyltransferase involved in cell wall biosynthesis